MLFCVSTYAQKFTLKTINGKILHFDITPTTLSIKEYPGKVVILDFFGANCPPCIVEMPDLVKFQEIFRESVQVIAIQSSSKRDNEKMIKFAQEHNLNYPVINLKEATNLIVYIQNKIKWNGALPYKLLFDFRTNLTYKLYGMISFEKLMKVIKQI